MIIFLAATIGLTIFLIPTIMSLTTDAGREQLKQAVESFGGFGWLIFLLLQILQVIVALIPGEPIEIIGGVLFGTFGGMALCLLGLLTGTIIVYYLVRAVGKPLVDAFVKPEQMEKLSFLQDESKVAAAVFVLYMIPGTPKDTLTYFVPLTKMKPLHFFILSTLARIPSVVSSTLVGEKLGEGSFLTSALIFGATAIIGLLGIFINDRYTKKKQRVGTEKKQ